MRRIHAVVLVALLAGSLVSCKTDQSVPADDKMTETPEPSPTPIPPTPTPAPVVPEGGYHVTKMTVATSKSQAIDIDGDGKPDYGLESALNEVTRFMVGRIDNVLDQLVQAELLTPEAALALKATAQATFSQAFNVDNIDEGLAVMLEQEQWIQVLTALSQTEVSLTFYTSTPVDQYTYYKARPLGDPFDGTFDEADALIDASGGTVSLSIPIVDAGPQPLMMDLPLKNCRDIQSFEPEADLKGAKLGGAIPIGAIVDVVTRMMDMLGILGLMPEDMVTGLQHDVEQFVTSLGDVTINGEEAISVSLVYDADVATIN